MNKITAFLGILVTVLLVNNLSAQVAKTGPNGRLADYAGFFANDTLIQDIGSLWDKTDEQLNNLRYEIYASYGHAFTNPDIKWYFNRRFWYKINPLYTDSLLTTNDKANAELLLSLTQPQIPDLETILEKAGALSFEDNGSIDPGHLFKSIKFTGKLAIITPNPQSRFKSNIMVPFQSRGRWINFQIPNLQVFICFNVGATTQTSRMITVQN